VTFTAELELWRHCCIKRSDLARTANPTENHVAIVGDRPDAMAIKAALPHLCP
jgi:hypothetical protein